MNPLRLYGSLALLLALIAGGCWLHHAGYKSGTADLASVKAENAAVLRDIADKARRAADLTKARERDIAAILESSNKAREEGIAHAVEDQQKLVSDLRAGNVKLRDAWAGCRSAVPRDAAAGSGADAAADDRAAAAAAIVRAGDDADITIAGLQRYAAACQALTQP